MVHSPRPAPARRPSQVKQLIVNADDFGMAPGVNRAILEAYRTGIVTSTSLLANSIAFDEAAAIARANPAQREISGGEDPESREQVLARGASAVRKSVKHEKVLPGLRGFIGIGYGKFQR